MAGIEIKSLGRKLRLLIDYGYFKTWEGLAEQFDVKAKTVQGWGHGSGVGDKDKIPQRHLLKLRQLVEELQLASETSQSVDQFIFAPVQDWVTVLTATTYHSINSLIEAEALTDCDAKVFMRQSLKPEAGLIEHDLNPTGSEPDFTVPRNAWFRIELQADLISSRCFIMQNVGQSWGGVPTSFKTDSKTIYIPGIKLNGDMAHIRECHQSGEHRFIIGQTTRLPPVEFTKCLEDNIQLDPQTVQKMVQFYLEQPKSDRRLYLINMKVTD